MGRAVRGAFLERGIYLTVLQKRLNGSLVPRALVSGFSDLDKQPKVKSERSYLLFHGVQTTRMTNSAYAQGSVNVLTTFVWK